MSRHLLPPPTSELEIRENKMSQEKKSFASVLIDLIKSIKSKMGENIDKGKLLITLKEFFLGKANDFARSYGVDQDFFRQFITKAVNLEKVGQLFTKNLKDLFKLGEEDNIIVEMYRKIGKEITRVADLPLLGLIIDQVSVFFGVLAAKVAPNRNLIIETEFAVENLEVLMDFGVRHEQLEKIAMQLFDRIYELDKGFADQILVYEKLKISVFQNIAKAHARVNRQIENIDKDLGDETSGYKEDLGKIINTI